ECGGGFLSQYSVLLSALGIRRIQRHASFAASPVRLACQHAQDTPQRIRIFSRPDTKHIVGISTQPGRGVFVARRFLCVRLSTSVLTILSAFNAGGAAALPPGVALVPGNSLAPDISIVEYAIPTANSVPDAIVSGPDGNLWFTESFTGRLGRITPAGQVSEFPVAATAIAAGPDGNVWFTEATAIGKITPAGQVTRYPYAGGKANGITLGPDGNLYFTDSGSKIGKITPQGSITEFPTPTAGDVPLGITLGADGNLSYTAMGCRTCDTTTPDTIGRITPAGAATEFQIPTPLA